MLLSYIFQNAAQSIYFKNILLKKSLSLKLKLGDDVLNSLALFKIRNIKRYQEILRILTKHGFGYILENLHLKISLNPFRKEKVAKHLPFHSAERLRLVLEELGPTFIKIGQILSTRPDLLPATYIQQLERLQDDIFPESFNKIQATIGQNLNRPLNELFQEINPKPIGTASIGQVHRGILITGESVIVKVQRSGVKKIVDTDLGILTVVTRFLENNTEWGKLYNLNGLIAEFSRSIHEELDYTIEASNAERIKENFTGDPTVIIPKIYWHYSAQEVLVMEYLEGTKISAPELELTQKAKKKLAEELINIVLKQILSHGFFHADLHPGNILIAGTGEIILIDFGMVGRIDSWTRNHLANLFLRLIKKDVSGVTNILIELGYTPVNVNKKGLQRELYYLLDKYSSLTVSQIKVGEIFREMMRLSLFYRIILPRDLYLVARSLVTLESNVERLDPEINWIKLAQPFGERLIHENLSPQNILNAGLNYFHDLSDLFGKLPDSIQSILSKIEEGKLQIVLEHRHFDKFITRLNLIGNRLSFSLIIAAIIVGTSLIAQRVNYSFLWQFPIAEIGFVVAVIMGVWLLISIIRSGRI